MRLIYNNQWDSYTLTESAEDANYPVENTQDIRLAKVWRTETASAASVVIAAGSAGLFVFRATTNLVQDPEDLTTGNWTEVNCDTELSDLYYDGKRFTKVTNVGANSGYVHQTLSDTWTTLTPSFSIIAKKGSSVNNITRLLIEEVGIVAAFELVFDWDNYPNSPGTASSGVLYEYKWIDSETLELQIICDTMGDLENDLRVLCFGSLNATADEYTYWTAVQAEDLPYSTPYVNGIRAATHPDETFEMPSKFTLDMIVRSWFTYDTAIGHRFAEWYIGAARRFIIYYESGAPHRMRAFWSDGGPIKYLESQRFGAGYIDINQRIRITISIDLTTGTDLGSRFIIIPLESGDKYEDTTWNGNIDAHTSTFSTLSIGHEDDATQADSQFEYIRIYEGTLVGTVDDSDDADALLVDMDILLDLNYLNKLTVDSAAIINHNLSADATIKIQGNDYDSWNGPPLDVTMTWREDTIVTFMSSASYPFWRFYIVNQNVEDGYFEIGRFMLGEYLQVDPSSLIEFPEKHVRNDRQAFSKSNQLYADQGSGWKELRYKFVNTGDTMKDKIETMWDLNGKHTPFLLMNYDSTFTIIPPIYCVITKDITFGHLLHDRWEYNFDLREAD